MTEFELTFRAQGKNIEEILKKIKKDGEKQGIHIHGNTEKGNFYAKNAKGSYEINDSIVKVSVNTLFFIPASLIQEELEKYFK
jgi:hypothetical protein